MSGDDDTPGVSGFGGMSKTRSWEDFTEKATRSQQADTDDHEGNTDYYEPPYDPDKLARLMERDMTHAACVRAKSQGVAGYGFELAPTEDDESPPGEDTLREFWHRGDFQLGPENKPSDASSVLENAWEDYEAIGWLSIEVLVNPNTGDPTGLAHIPAHTVRKRKGAPGYVQIDNGIIQQYFGEAGDRYPGDDGDQTFVDAEDGDTGSSVAEVDSVANELIFIRNYSALAPHYGTPDIVPALPTIAGDLEAREYNLRFFENDGVPRFAMMVEGGELNERAYESIKDQLKDLKEDENAHRGMLIEAIDAATGKDADTGNVSVSIEPLTVGVQEDASFIEYRQENEHDILKVHKVPPVVVNRTEDSNYANSREQRQEFAQTTIKPRQEDLEERLYRILHVLGFGIEGWRLDLELRGGENKMREAEIATKKIKDSQGVYTVNEAREAVGLEPLADGADSPLPQGEMLLAELASQNPGSAPSDGDSGEVADETEAMVRSDERAESLGYSVTARTDGGD